MTVYATSSTESGIRKLIAEFFGGEHKELHVISENEFLVLKGNGEPIPGAKVVKTTTRGRTKYSFGRE